MMMLPDYSSGNNEKDIHVKNFNINVGGLELLDSADLKLAYGRKVLVFMLCCCCLLWRPGGILFLCISCFLLTLSFCLSMCV